MQATPFEKNLNVWRQLWRVIERSDVVVQIVDARNPLVFRCVCARAPPPRARAHALPGLQLPRH